MMKKKAVSGSAILRAVVSLGEQIRGVKSELEAKIDTKVDSAREDILKEIRPIAKAVDIDARLSSNTKSELRASNPIYH